MSKKLSFTSRELEIVFNEKIYKLRYPTVEDIRGYNKRLNAKDAIELHVVADMLTRLGMPKTTVDKMELPFIEAIVEELTSRKK